MSKRLCEKFESAEGWLIYPHICPSSCLHHPFHVLFKLHTPDLSLLTLTTEVHEVAAHPYGLMHSCTHSCAQDLDWTTTLVSTTFELPFTKSLSTEVHVAVQRVLELVLTLPDVRVRRRSE
eukprot:1145032-Pelagomonas_calceolata.AAC.1